MYGVDISTVDLNLLIALDSLLSTHSVTEAARRSGLKQSSMSHSLARLRDLFGDPLLVREGRGMRPTPRADALRAPVRRVLAEIGRLLQAETEFEPASSARRFTIACPDLLASFLPELFASLQGAAPSVGLEIRTPPQGDILTALRDGSDDLAIGPPRPGVAGVIQRKLGSIRWAVCGRADHPALCRRLSRKSYTAFPHVVVRTGSPGKGYVAEVLAAEGLDRQIGLAVPSFTLALLALRRTDLLMTAPRELVVPLVGPLGLRYRAPPVELPEVPLFAYWAERLHHDQGLRWLRARVIEVLGAELL